MIYLSKTCFFWVTLLKIISVYKNGNMHVTFSDTHFLFFFSHSRQLVGSYLPNQGWDVCPYSGKVELESQPLDHQGIPYVKFFWTVITIKKLYHYYDIYVSMYIIYIIYSIIHYKSHYNTNLLILCCSKQL